MLLFRGSLAFPPRPFVPGHCSCFRIVVHVQSGGTFTLRAARLSLAHRIWILPPSAVVPNPKSETRNKFKCPMFQGSKPPGVWWFWSFPAWCLGFVSGFEFRISSFRALDGGSFKMHPWPCAAVKCFYFGRRAR